MPNISTDLKATSGQLNPNDCPKCHTPRPCQCPAGGSGGSSGGGSSDENSNNDQRNQSTQAPTPQSHSNEIISAKEKSKDENELNVAAIIATPKQAEHSAKTADKNNDLQNAYQQNLTASIAALCQCPLCLFAQPKLQPSVVVKLNEKDEKESQSDTTDRVLHHKI